MTSATKHQALHLFRGLPRRYDQLSAALSFWQDPRWRRALVDAVAPAAGERILDVATGTGMVAAELLSRADCTVVGLDQSPEMLAAARARFAASTDGARVRLVEGQAERLPFDDAGFDALTFTYLLRYVDDPPATLRELARVLRPGGRVASLEFGVPARALPRAAWRLYTAVGLPVLGRLFSDDWAEVGRFLGPSIAGFYARHPLPRLVDYWQEAGFQDVRVRRMSLGGGVVMSATRSRPATPQLPLAGPALGSARMGERTEHRPGAFCWVDLTTTDQESAKAFYSGLFDWEAEDMPVGEGIYYSMQRLGGLDVAAISPQPQQQRDAGAPPVWNSYVSVQDADAAVERAKELGATVPVPAFDVMQAGRMAAIQDPQGAFFLVWQPREHFGAKLVNAPGALVWNELSSEDLDASTAFYSGLFGWTIAPFEGSPEPYLSIKNGSANNGGIRPLPSPGPSPNWLVYFGVEDLDDALAKVERLGGSKHAGPIDIQIAKIAIVADPQGAIFALYAGQLEP